jgi:hypothetical protein
VQVEHPGGQVWTVRGSRHTVLATSTWGTSRLLSKPEPAVSGWQRAVPRERPDASKSGARSGRLRAGRGSLSLAVSCPVTGRGLPPGS